MSPDTSKPFPIYQLQDAFEAFCNGEPTARPQHRSLYYFLLGYCRRRGNTPRFSLAYEAGMHGSGIGSWATYDAALKALAEWGFIVYTPGANRFKVPVVELTFRNPTEDVLLTYWQSYCISTSNPTGDVSTTLLVTLKEELKEEREKVEKLESEKALLRADVAAADAALTEAQKKIDELTDAVVGQSASADPNASASHTEGGGADVGTSVVPLRVSRGGKFEKPSRQQLVDYLTSLPAPPPNPAALADRFLNHYDGVGWKIGRNPMKDWQATARNWVSDNRPALGTTTKPNGNPQQPAGNRYNTTARGGFGGFAGPAPVGRVGQPGGSPGAGGPAAGPAGTTS